jgi:2-hydroxy-3-keto-5-methylthiopentenyl-1-phosphate phosphatase
VSGSPPLHVFTDFDGTITIRDTLVFLTERLGGGPRVVEVNTRLMREGKISLRQCLAGNMRSIRAPFEEAVRLLRTEVALDPAFPAFVRWCEARGVPLTVLSGGFAEIVDIYLPRAEFPMLEVRANTLRPDPRKGWQCVFRDASVFGYDKREALHEARRRGHRSVFIGDGFSDRASAEVADEVLAKPGLAAYCREQGIRCEEIGGFDDVLRHLEARLSASGSPAD